MSCMTADLPWHRYRGTAADSIGKRISFGHVPQSRNTFVLRLDGCQPLSNLLNRQTLENSRAFLQSQARQQGVRGTRCEEPGTWN